MKKPKVVVHMHISLDGKINGPHLMTEASQLSQREYYNIMLGENAYYSQTKDWLNGTDSSHVLTGHNKPEIDESITEVEPGDFIADVDFGSRYFTIDNRGELAWQKNFMTYFETKAHIVVLIPESVSPAYRQFLRDQDISYLIAGKDAVDIELAIEKVMEYYPSELFMVNGGGGINWSYLDAGLVDEISIVLTPVIDSNLDSKQVFYNNPKYNSDLPKEIYLEHVEVLADGSVWLRYLTENPNK